MIYRPDEMEQISDSYREKMRKEEASLEADRIRYEIDRLKSDNSVDLLFPGTEASKKLRKLYEEMDNLY